MAKLDRKLNLVSTLDLVDGSSVTVHSMPVSRATFEAHFLVMAKTMGAILTEDLSVVGGPRIAALMLREISQNLGVWDGPAGVERTLLAEMRRLSNVMMPKDGGYDITPLQSLLDQKQVDDDSFGEFQNALVFFTLVSAVLKRPMGVSMIKGMGSLWDTRGTSSSLMELQASLQTLTTDANTGGTAAAS